MFKRRQKGEITRVFYAGDVHGSRLCWKKFVNAARHYPADALVMGGDLTGKALVPIVREGDGSYRARVIAASSGRLGPPRSWTRCSGRSPPTGCIR